MPSNSDHHDPEQTDGMTPTVEELSSERFREWWRGRKYRRNIENGKPYFNGPSCIPDPERHTPSQLLQCHRKVFYRQENAPEEDSDPNGIFWFGTRFEEDIIFPFFRDALTTDDTYVRNSVWVDYTIETGASELRIKGSTDPLIVDADAVPLLPSEIKTKGSLDHISEPNEHHRAQLHAYMEGLSQKYDIELSNGVIVYGSRDSLETRFFHIEFDHEFWENTVLNWASNHTEFRLNRRLPPPQPEYSWECEFCSYRERCGQGTGPPVNSKALGLVPRVDYPREKVLDYLESHPGALLPPTVADTFPELGEEYGVFDWRCDTCSNTTSWSVPGDGGRRANIVCSDCRSKGIPGEMRSPSPAEQERRIQSNQSTEDETGGGEHA